jgi:hypothetical protein
VEGKRGGQYLVGTPRRQMKRSDARIRPLAVFLSCNDNVGLCFRLPFSERPSGFHPPQTTSDSSA